MKSLATACCSGPAAVPCCWSPAATRTRPRPPIPRQRRPPASTPSAEAQAAAASSAAAAGAATAAADAAAASPPMPPRPPTRPRRRQRCPALVAGTDYAVIPGGQPFEPLNGKIEVVEVFGYVCPACAAFQPLLSAWKKKLPADVRFTYVPAAFGREWDAVRARRSTPPRRWAWSTQTHDAVFHAIHIEQSLPVKARTPTSRRSRRSTASTASNPKEFAEHHAQLRRRRQAQARPSSSWSAAGSKARRR